MQSSRRSRRTPALLRLPYDLKYHTLTFLSLDAISRWLDADAALCADVCETLILHVLHHVQRTRGENVDGKLCAALLTDDVVPCSQRGWLFAAIRVMNSTKNGWQKLVGHRKLRNVFEAVIPSGEALYLPYDAESVVSRVLLSLWASSTAGCCTSVHVMKSAMCEMTAAAGTLPSTLELVRCDVDALRAATWEGHRQCIAALCCSGRWKHLVKEARDTKTSPLHITALRGHTHCVQFLLDAGYDVNAVEDGASAWFLARHQHECAGLLQRHGGLNIVHGQVQDYNFIVDEQDNTYSCHGGFFIDEGFVYPDYLL